MHITTPSTKVCSASRLASTPARLSRRAVLVDLFLVAEGMRLAVFGFAIVLAGAFAARHVMASLLDEMKRNDPAVVLGTNWGRPGSGGCFGGVFRSSRRA